MAKTKKSEETETKEDVKVEAKLEAEEEKTEVKEAVKEEKEAKAGRKKEAVKEEKETTEEKKKKLLERAKKLSGDVKEEKGELKLKEKLKEEKEEDKKNLLVPIEDYLKSSIYLGTRVITPDMRKYVYRRRADGLAVFNTTLLDEKMKECANYLSKFEPKDIIVVCKREAGWKAAQKFAETLGMRFFTKKYPAGILTNTNLSTFQEAELVFVCDPWLDKNALADANRIKIPVMSVCDTNNYTRGITQIVPGNNKSAKSLGMIFYLMTKLYIENKKLDIKAPIIQDFVDDWDNLQPPQ
jgi:small subunit ribosomal protein S2